MKKEQQTTHSIASLNRLEANYQLLSRKALMTTALKPTSSRIVTASVAKYIPLEQQDYIWKLIDSLPVESDYLQVFELSYNIGMRGEPPQCYVQSQERPEYCEFIVCPVKKPIFA